MRRRGIPLGVLAVALLAAGLLAPSAAAAPVQPSARGEPAETEACAGGPCPIFLYFKGDGSGRVSSTPPGFLECRSTCALEVPDDTTDILTLHARSDTGTNLPKWEKCPKPTGPNETDCEINLRAQGATYVMCVVFTRTGSTPPDSQCPPPSTTPPPPPAPPPPPPSTKAPPLGSKCTIVGSAQADLIYGTPRDDVICGLGGNDRIYGGGGHDLILGGAGNDRIWGGPGNDLILGGAGNDVIVGQAGRDRMYGGRGRDVFYARDRARDLVVGGAGFDRARVDRSDRLRSIEKRS